MHSSDCVVSHLPRLCHWSDDLSHVLCCLWSGDLSHVTCVTDYVVWHCPCPSHHVSHPSSLIHSQCLAHHTPCISHHISHPPSLTHSKCLVQHTSLQVDPVCCPDPTGQHHVDARRAPWQQQQHRARNNFLANHSSFSEPAAPTAESVAAQVLILGEMGFAEEIAQVALLANHGNLDWALAALCAGPTTTEPQAHNSQSNELNLPNGDDMEYACMINEPSSPTAVLAGTPACPL